MLPYSNKHIPNGTNLPTQPRQQNINNSRYIELSYGNHLGSAAGLLCTGIPAERQHWGLGGHVGNPPWTGGSSIPETSVNVSKGHSPMEQPWLSNSCCISILWNKGMPPSCTPSITHKACHSPFSYNYLYNTRGLKLNSYFWL